MSGHSGSSKPSKKAYVVESKSLGDLAREYPHSPENFTASLQDYVNAKADAGLEVTAMSDSDNGMFFVFRAH